MKKLSSIYTLALTSLLFSCGGYNESADQKTAQTDTLSAEVSTKTIEEPIVSLSMEQAKERKKAILKANNRKYKDYGTVEENDLIAGNYTKDGALDYFYTVHFYPGGDFVYPTHFFYDSQKDAIRELELGKGPNAFQHIVVKKITEGKLYGNAVIWSAFSGEHTASKEVKAEFTIDGNKVNVVPTFLPALNKAEKKVLQELEKMEREMMEESDAYSSEEGI
jgi:hypothetical protein